jgi:hypothetical protein
MQEMTKMQFVKSRLRELDGQRRLGLITAKQRSDLKRVYVRVARGG